MKKYLTMMAVTMAAMYLANRAAAMNPTARKLLKGQLLTVAGTNDNSNTVTAV